MTVLSEAFEFAYGAALALVLFVAVALALSPSWRRTVRREYFRRMVAAHGSLAERAQWAALEAEEARLNAQDIRLEAVRGAE